MIISEKLRKELASLEETSNSVLKFFKEFRKSKV